MVAPGMVHLFVIGGTLATGLCSAMVVYAVVVVRAARPLSTLIIDATRLNIELESGIAEDAPAWPGASVDSAGALEFSHSLFGFCAGAHGSMSPMPSGALGRCGFLRSLWRSAATPLRGLRRGESCRLQVL